MRYFLPIVVLLFSSCQFSIENPFKEDLEKTYLIKKGEHQSNRIPQQYDSSVLRFDAMFDYSAMYATDDSSNQTDINKLLGFSDCGSNHKENSARFGWRWYNDELQIFAYCYIEGKRYFEYITDVALNQLNSYSITITDNGYLFAVNDAHEFEMKRNQNCGNDSKYLLFPYFGGNEPAPQDIMVRIVRYEK